MALSARDWTPVQDRFDARYVGYSVSAKFPALTSHCRKAVTAGASLLVSGA
jgi:hypothetical protein